MALIGTATTGYLTGSAEHSVLPISGSLALTKGGDGVAELRLHEDQSNGDLYTGWKAGAVTTSVVYAMPAADGSDGQQLTTDGSGVLTWAAGGGSVAADDVSAGDAAVTISTTSGAVTVDSNAGAVSIDGHTGVTVASSNSGNITIDSVADVVLSADGGNVTMDDGTSTIFDFNVDNTTLTIHDDQDTGDQVVMTVTQHGAFSIVTVDDDAAAANIQITADGTAELAGTTVTLDSGGDIALDATDDINVPADVGLTFGDDGEKIEGNGTKLTIASSSDLDLTVTDVVLTAQTTKIEWGGAGSGEHIVGAGTNELTIAAGADINLTAAAGDINIPADIGLTFGDDGEKIEGDGTDLTIAASGQLNVNTDTVIFGSANAADPMLQIKNTTDDAAGARLRFVKARDSAAGADGDDIGLIEFYGGDDAQAQTLFAKITAEIADASNSAEGGKISLGVATHDGEFQNGLILTDGSAEDEIDVTVGNGSASITTVAGSMILTTVAAAGTDTDKFLCLDGSGNVDYRSGSDLASDIGAVSLTNSNTFEHASGQIFQGDEGNPGIIYIKADQGDDAGDEWKINVADGGIMTIGNDIASAGTFVSFLTLTPHATVASSVVSVTGDLTVGDDLSLSTDSSVLKFGDGSDVTFTHDGGTGMDIVSAGTLDVGSTAGSMTVGSALADGQTIKLGKSGAVEVTIAPHGTAAAEMYTVKNTSGTTDGTQAGGSAIGAVNISALAGGMGLTWADTKDLHAEGGSMMFVANEDKASCIQLHADAGTSQTIHLLNDAGTSVTEGAAAIQLLASAGGVNIKGNIDAASAVLLTADGGTSATMVVHNDQGTAESAAGSQQAASIQLMSDAGGIGLSWADGKDLWAEGGRAVITANEDAADCIKLHADAGTSQTINLLNDAGTATTAIALTATAGGITLTTNSGKVVTVAGGDLVPGANGTLDLGGASARWANIYTSDMHFANERGDWTLIEENDYITFRNNHTGRRFRMMMEDITDSGDFGPDINGTM